jgi:hypothetical protein
MSYTPVDSLKFALFFTELFNDNLSAVDIVYCYYEHSNEIKCD